MAGRGLRRPRGFTLVEVLVALAIGLGISAMALAVFSSVARTVQRVGEEDREWMTQRLLRKQLWACVDKAGDHALPFVGDTDRLQFPSRTGLLDGGDGPPVVASYAFDITSGTLRYREQPMPAWWKQAATPIDQRWPDLSRASAAAREENALSGLTRLRLAYRDSTGSDAAAWQDTWRAARPPEAVRVDFERNGQRGQWIIEVMAGELP